jgi:hypothetical protein
MQNPELPRLKRSFPKIMVLLFSFIFYCVAVPINWVMTVVGKGRGLFLRSNKRQAAIQAKILTAFDQYTPDEHDVFVNTFSKSGTNWTLQMCHQISFLGEGEFDNIHDVVPWPDMYVQMKGKFIVPLGDKLVTQASPSHLRVIKSHLAAQYIPYNEKARYITVLRDPKDVLVSSYHFQAGIIGPLMPSVDDWLDSFLGEHFPLGFSASWAQHTASYWALRERPNVLVLSFKEMKKDLAGTVKQVAAFMGVELADEQLEKVITLSSFDYMKGVDEKFFPIKKNAFPWMNAQMVRKGKDGNSKEMISLEQQRRIDEHFINELKTLGSDFPYEEFCRMAE